MYVRDGHEQVATAEHFLLELDVFERNRQQPMPSRPVLVEGSELQSDEYRVDMSRMRIQALPAMYQLVGHLVPEDSKAMRGGSNKFAIPIRSCRWGEVDPLSNAAVARSQQV